MGLFSSIFGSDKPKGATGQPAGLKGTGYQQLQTQNFTPEQMQLFQRLFGQVGPESQLGKLAGGDQSQFEQLEAPALQQFGALQSGLASRYSGMGSGARRSSGFQNESNQYASNFAQLLQSQRLGLQRQAMQDLRGMSSELLGARPYEQYLTEEQRPAWKTGLGAALPVGGALLGGYFGGVPGALAGGKIGSKIGQSFLD